VWQKDLGEQALLLALCSEGSEARRQDLKTTLQRVKNPTGRLDWLAAKLVEQTVKEWGNPFMQELYSKVREPLERGIRGQFSPRKKAMKDLKKYILEGNRMIEAAQRRAS
jgi:hypothetical protein